MQPSETYKIFPLGDSAITIDFGNVIDEQINHHIISVFQYLMDNPLQGQTEVVPTFSSLTVYYNIQELKKAAGWLTVSEWMKEKLKVILKKEIDKSNHPERVMRIPVCYEKEFATDIEMISAEKRISVEEIIRIHSSISYRVYMLGFLPGFAYMGKLDEQISFARKLQPQNIKAGSVGIAGFQTGIYPLDSPGGWQIIGRTPVNMFNRDSKGITFLKAGDTVQFYSITKNEFEDIKSRHS